MLSKNMAELDTVGPVVWPKWCYSSNHQESETSTRHATICKAPVTKARRKKVNRAATAISGTATGVKNERCTPEPDIGNESPRSESPHSPGSSSFRTRTPSFAGTPPNPPFTPPERFSPASFNNNNNNNSINNNNSNNKAIMEGLNMSRNYSDFMRSLAAKYNNSNPNEYRVGYAAGLDPRFATYKPSTSSASSGFPLLNLPLGPLGPAMAAAAAAKKEAECAATASASGKKSTSPTLPLGLPALMAGLNNNQPALQAAAAAAAAAGLPPFPMIDMSSTQALINIVRSASAQNAQQLDTYLRSSGNNSSGSSGNKRPSEASSSPLDLSASVASKRPCYGDSAQLKSASELVKLVSTAAAATQAAKKSPTSPRDHQRRQAAMAAPAAFKQSPSTMSALPIACRLSCAADACSPGAVQVGSWCVDDVVDFVSSIDLCCEYAQVFRDHAIDGCTLPLLTEEHLISNMNMKLGPALKLRSVLAKKIGHCAVCLHCVHCHSEPQQQQPDQDNNPVDNN